MGVVLGRGADHGGPADIDVFHAVIIARARGDGRLEGVEVDDDQVDGADVMGVHCGTVLGIVAPGEDPAVDFRVQGFHPPVHDLGEARMVRDFRDRHAGLGECAGRAAGGQDLDIVTGERRAELGQPRLVGNGDEGARDLRV